MNALDRQTLIHYARNAVLHALDDWARESGLPGLPHLKEGAIDADLPHIFPAIDAQVDRVIARSSLLLPDVAPVPQYSPAQMAALIMTGKLP